MYNRYYLCFITDANGKSIEIVRNPSTLRDIHGRIESVIDPDRPNDPLLSFQYQGDTDPFPHKLQSITDRAGRTVSYAFRTGPETGKPELYRLSQMDEGTSAYRQQYEYTSRAGQPYLSKVTSPHPSGTGTASTEIHYNQTVNSRTGLFHVTSTKDSNGFVREYTYYPTGCTVDGRTLSGVVTKATVKRETSPDNWDVDREFYQKFDPTTLYSTGRYENGRESTITYGTSSHNKFRPVQVKDFNGRITQYTWDAYGNLTDVRWPSLKAPQNTPTYTKAHADYIYGTGGFPNLARVETWTGDASLATPRKTATKYHFDSLGRLTYVDRPVSGQVGAASWVRTTLGYDTLGNLTTLTARAPNDPGGTDDYVTATLSYTDASHPAASKGQPLSVSIPKGDGQNLVRYFEWNPDGTLLAAKDALGNRTVFTYDAARRLETVAHPVTEAGKTRGAETRFHRGFAGGPVNLTEVFSEGTAENQALLANVSFGYDAAGELNDVSGDTEPWRSTHDAEYRLLSLADARGQAGNYRTTYAYPHSATSVGATVTYPENATEGGIHDTVNATETHPVGDALYGSNVTIADGRGVIKTLVYNTHSGLLTDVQYSRTVPCELPATYNVATDNLHYEYDLYGRVIKARHGVSDTNFQDKTTYAYDDLDNLTSATITYGNPDTGASLFSKTITYSYYPNGSLKSLSIGGVGTFTYTYNLIGQATSLTNPIQQATGYVYDANGRLSRQNKSNGDYSIWTYDARSRVRSIQNTLAFQDGQQSQSLNYVDIRRDALGNITYYRAQASNPSSYGAKSGEVWYGYDSGIAGQPYGLLYSEVSTLFLGLNRSYTYDAAYNPVTFRTATALTYNNDNQQTGIGFDYDGNGNPTKHRGSDALYDVENRLVSFGTSPYSISTYGYTAGGFRSWKSTDGDDRTFYLYLGGLPVLEMNSSGTAMALNTFGPAGLISRSEGEIGYSPTTRWYTFDPSGNVAVRVTGGGYDPVEVIGPSYDAFGQDQGAGLSDCFGFAGQWGAYTDNQGYGAWSRAQGNSRVSTREALPDSSGYGTGLVLMGYRYYDPNTGRFLTRDPIGYAGGINLYAYCGNNPVNFVDPLGLSPTDGWGTDADPLIRGLEDAFPEWRDEWALPLASLLVEGYLEAGESLMGAPGLALEAMGTFDSPGGGPPKRGGRLGNQETRDQVAEIADDLAGDGWTITGGGGREKEEYIPPVDGGRRGGAYPDITARKGNTTYRVNTIDTLADGVTPTKREARNAERIRRLTPGELLDLIPKRKGSGR